MPRLRSFSAFAAGFSYLSILTGVPQFFYFGFSAAGPAFVWTWPAVFAGQLLVALCFAELSARFPLAGGVYQWSKFAGSWAVGWMTGWVYLASYVVTVAAVALALPPVLVQLTGVQVLSDPTANAVAIGVGLIAATTIINSVGVRLMAAINNVGVFSELLGAIFLVALLAFAAVRPPSAVLETLGRGAGQPGGYLAALLTAALMPSLYVMYGFDTAAELSEETRDPRRRVPRAILQALGTAALLGGLLLLTGVMAAPDLHDPALGQQAGGLPGVMAGVLGPVVGRAFLADVAFAIFVCTLAVHAGAVRLVFAMARDNNLPAGRALARVRSGGRPPVLPAVAVGVLATVVLLAFAGSSKLMETVGSVAVAWANLAYLLVTAPLLARRLAGRWTAAPEFTLGRWGTFVNLLAVVWGVALIVNVSWPRPEVYGEPWYQLYAAPLGTAALLAIGGAYYALVQRHRTGVLEEHRAEGARIAEATAAAG